MKVLVTGSNGFIGSRLVEVLLQRNFQVRCLVRKTSNIQWLKNLDVEFYYGELLRQETLFGAVDGMNKVFHLAGTTKARNQKGYMDGNYRATLNLLSACKLSGNKPRFVFVSSQAACGPSLNSRPRTEEDHPHPVSLYGVSKLIAEQAVLGHSRFFPVVIVRPPSVYGPRDRDVYVMFKNVKRGFLPVINRGRQKVSMVHVDDLVEGLILASEETARPGQIYHIAGDEQLAWKEIGQIMASSLGRKLRMIPVPYPVVDIVSFANIAVAALSGRQALLNRDKVREMKQESWLLSNEKAKNQLGFTPRFTLEKGFEQTVEWYRKNGWL